MTYTTDSAIAELKRFGRWRTERVLEIAAAGEPDQIHGTFLLAIASRETNCRNVVGGGYFDPEKATPSNPKGWVETGVDRGLFQVNDHYHAAWLRDIPGCASGTYEEIYDSCLPAGRVPGLSRGAKKCRDLLRDRIATAARNGVPDADQIRVACAAYNAGSYWANKDYKDYGDPDRHTTGADYSHDVLERQRAFRRAIARLGWGG